jgi:hypothetical protein
VQISHTPKISEAWHAREWKLPGSGYTDPNLSGADLQAPAPALRALQMTAEIRQGGSMWFSTYKKIASKVMNKWLQTAQIAENWRLTGRQVCVDESVQRSSSLRELDVDDTEAQ